MPRKKNIENNSAPVIDEEHLLAYLDGSMLPEEQHRIEEILEADPFLNDAVEGLSEIKDKQQLRVIAAQINAQLNRQIQNRRKQRRNRPRAVDRWSWIFVLILLLLVLLSWWVMSVVVK